MESATKQISDVLNSAVDLLCDAGSDRYEALTAVVGLTFWKKLVDDGGRPGAFFDQRFAVQTLPEANWYSVLARPEPEIPAMLWRAQTKFEAVNPNLPRVFSQGELLAALSPSRVGSNFSAVVELLRRIQVLRISDAELDVPGILGPITTALFHRNAVADPRLGESATPASVIQLIAQIAGTKPHETVYDPVCGTGSLLATCASTTQGRQGPTAFGRDRSARSWALATIILYFHRVRAVVTVGDSLREPAPASAFPWNTPGGFDVVVANPPFSLQWNSSETVNFPHMPVPLRNADYVFIQHILGAMNQTGRAAVLVPQGVLFRSGGEKQIRERLVELDLFEAIIGLPPLLFYNSSIAVCLVIFNRSKHELRRKRVLFVDASREFTRERHLRQLSSETIATVVSAYKNFAEVSGTTRVVETTEILENEFDLSIARYVKLTPQLERSLAEELSELRRLQSKRNQMEKNMLEALEQLPPREC